MKRDSKQKNTYFSAAQIEDRGSIVNTTRLSTNLRYLPIPALRTKNNGFSCVLCRWATGSKYSSHFAKCVDCNVYLCLWCYQPYHTVALFNEKFQNSMCKEIKGRKPKRGAKKKTNTIKGNNAAITKRKS